MATLLEKLEIEIEKLKQIKLESSSVEQSTIAVPFSKLTTAITEYNKAASEIIGNNLRRKAVEWKERERQLHINIESLNTLALNTFGIYDISWIQRAITSNPKWYDRLNFERRNFNKIAREMNHMNNEKLKGIKSTEYSDIQIWEEVRQIKAAQYDDLFEMFKNEIKIIQEKMKSAIKEQDVEQFLLLKTKLTKLRNGEKELKNAIDTLENTSEIPNKLDEILDPLEKNQENESRIAYNKEKITRIPKLLEEINQKEEKLIEEKTLLANLLKKRTRNNAEKAKKQSDIADQEKKIKELETELTTKQEELIEKAPNGIQRVKDNYLEEQMRARGINSKQLKLEKKQKKDINPKIFTEKEYKDIIFYWNQSVKNLQQELKNLEAEKQEMISDVSEMLDNIDDNINNTNIMRILKEVYDMEQVYEKKYILIIKGENGEPDKKYVTTEVISKEEYLENLRQEDKQNKIKMNVAQKQITELDEQLVKGNAGLTEGLTNWSDQLNRINKAATELEADIIKKEKTANKSDNVLNQENHDEEENLNAGQIWDLKTKADELLNSLNQFLERNPTIAHKWFKEVPTIISTTTTNTNPSRAKTLGKIPCLFEEDSKQIEQNIIQHIDLGENLGRKVVVVEKREAGLKLFGQEVNFKWPTLLEVARNGNVVMSGDLMTSDDSKSNDQTDKSSPSYSPNSTPSPSERSTSNSISSDISSDETNRSQDTVDSGRITETDESLLNPTEFEKKHSDEEYSQHIAESSFNEIATQTEAPASA